MDHSHTVILSGGKLQKYSRSAVFMFNHQSLRADLKILHLAGTKPLSESMLEYCYLNQRCWAVSI